jgi:hypothetical protein
MYLKLRLQITLATSSATGASTDSGVRQRRCRRRQKPKGDGLPLASQSEALPGPMDQKNWSRPSNSLSGPSFDNTRGDSPFPRCFLTKSRNHSLNSRARSATWLSSAGEKLDWTMEMSFAVTRPACLSQSRKSFPLPIHSTTVSTGIATELRKSTPGEPEMKMAGGNLSGIKSFFELTVQIISTSYLYNGLVVTVKKIFDRLQCRMYSPCESIENGVYRLNS